MEWPSVSKVDSPTKALPSSVRRLLPGNPLAIVFFASTGDIDEICRLNMPIQYADLTYDDKFKFYEKFQFIDDLLADDESPINADNCSVFFR